MDACCLPVEGKEFGYAKWWLNSDLYIRTTVYPMSEEWKNVTPKYPAEWNYSRNSADGILRDFSTVVLRLETTNLCNYSCSFCPHSQITRPHGFMDTDLAKSIIDQAVELGVKHLCLQANGEPSLDSRIAELSLYAREQGIDEIYFHTNGYNVSQETYKEWIDAGATCVFVTLSPKREYAATRNIKNVDKFFDDIAELRELPDSYKNCMEMYIIRTDFTTEEENQELLDFVEPLGIRHSINYLHNWSIGQEAAERYLCHRLFSSIMVLVTGEISLCCLDWDGKHILGDLNKTPLKDLINSEEYVTIRKNHIAGKFLPCCACCDQVEEREAKFD